MENGRGHDRGRALQALVAYVQVGVWVTFTGSCSLMVTVTTTGQPIIADAHPLKQTTSSHTYESLL